MLLAPLVALVFIVLAPRAALADDPEVSATVDTTRLGVGELLRLSLHVSSRQEQPGQPSPGSTPGFTIMGTSSSPSQQVTITNGRMVSQRGLDVAWTLRADRVGKWSIGPVSVHVGNGNYRAGPIVITVVEAGQSPPRPAPDPHDPFGRMNPMDPFGGGNPFDPFRSLLDSLNGQPPTHDAFGSDPKLALDAPRGGVAFLHAIVDQTDVVVGQQVTVSMYLYAETGARDPGMVDVHEATAADFVKRSLFEDDGADRAVVHAIVGGRVYSVRLLRKWALFPIKTGDLVVTPMELTLQRNRATGDPSRKSELLTIHVTDPPAEHRPPGYMLGDVGKFELSADTRPREIEQDDAVGVTLTITGTGNLPSMITPPAEAGIEWLPPEVHEKVGAMPGDHFGGARTFTYVVRLHRTGDVDLGAITLPYWEPAAKRYEVARASLGVVTVRPSATPKPAAELPPDPFATMPDARPQMGGTKAPATHLAETHPSLFWLAVLATPLGFFAFSGLSWGVKAVRERARERAESPETELKSRLSAAETAARGADARALSAATARALEAATVVYVDVNVRDARGAESRDRLVEAGVEEELAGRVQAVLTDCEAARFSPEAPELAAARARWTEAKGAIEILRRAS